MRAAPKDFLRRLREIEPRLECVYDEGRSRWIVRQRVWAHGRPTSYFREMVICEGPNGEFRELGSGDWVIEEIRRMDIRRRFRSVDHAWEELHRRDLGRRERMREETREQSEYLGRQVHRRIERDPVYHIPSSAAE